MIFRIFPTKDAFLTNYRLQNVPQTASNFGTSEILHLFTVAPYSSSAGIASGTVARILTKFDVNSFREVTGSITGSVTYRLRLADARHDDTIPTSYDVQVHQLTRDWDEGRGRDTDEYGDRGFANWDKAQSTVFWSTTGSDFAALPVSVQHFDGGNEDLSVDVTAHVNSWLSGSVTNNGFLVRMSSSLENSSQDYYIKMFHSRETHFGDRIPYLEASWNDVQHTGSAVLADGRGPFFVNVTNLRNEYFVDEKPRLRLFVRNRDYNPAVVLTASSGPLGLAVDRAYYRVDNDHTDEVVVPFGTGSNQSTRLSWDVSGSYFDFHMSNLPSKEVYRFLLLFDISGSRHIIDQGFKFRVRT